MSQKYLCMQVSRPGAKRTPPSPAQMEEMYAAFNAWREKFEDNIVDMGGKLGGGKVVRAAGVTDGPLMEAKEVIGGYMILRATSLEEAIEIARGVPGLVGETSGVVVREIVTP